jgi:Na+/proline symporter
LLWFLLIGAIFTLRVKNPADMFAAGGESPWWVSGLSGYMNIFSAATFVVWGGVAFRHGITAVFVLMIIGLSTILIGLTVAGRWRKLDITTPAEYLRLRFNEPVVQLYTWMGLIYNGLAMGVGLYALAIVLVPVVPLAEGAPFRDADTGHLSVNCGILLWGAIIIAYTMLGGLWAVLMTDVVQTLIVCLLVLVVAPLSLDAVGGIERLWNEAPEGFFSPSEGDYTAGFLFLWFWLSFFRYGADWAFVQRYICVPTPRDARNVAFLMGGLYILSPILWMIPSMSYRIIDSNADPEQAYVLMCRHVLPTGMLGIMLASMFSATASGVSTLLNVFAGVFTCDIYQRFLNPAASERKLVMVGRLATFGYGASVIGVAMLVPVLGGAEEVVLILVTALMGPLMLPVIWGLYSRHINHRAAWITFAVCGTSALGWRLLTLLGFDTGRFNGRIVDALLGLALPFAVLLAIELHFRRTGLDAGWQRMQAAIAASAKQPLTPAASQLPNRIIAISLGMLGITMAVVAWHATQQQIILAGFSIVLIVMTTVIGRSSFWSRRDN